MRAEMAAVPSSVSRISDDMVASLPSLRVPTLMTDAAERRRLAAETLEFARRLG